MSSKYSLRSVIICDGIRREDNGKELLIGVYPGAIRVPIIPFSMPILAIRFEVDITKREYNQVNIKVTAPNKIDIINTVGVARFDNYDFPGSIPFEFGPVTLAAEGMYEIHFGLDEPPKRVYVFKVTVGQALPIQLH